MSHFPWSWSHVEKEYRGFQQFNALIFYIGKVKCITEKLQVTKAAAWLPIWYKKRERRESAWPFPTLRNNDCISSLLPSDKHEPSVHHDWNSRYHLFSIMLLVSTWVMMLICISFLMFVFLDCDTWRGWKEAVNF